MFGTSVLLRGGEGRKTLALRSLLGRGRHGAGSTGWVGDGGMAVSVTGGMDSSDCLNCQGAEQTLGGSPSVLRMGMATLSHASKFCK